MGPARRLGGGRELCFGGHPSRRASNRVKRDRSETGIVHSNVCVKDWRLRVPDVEAVRPTRCPWCKAASRVPGERLGLHGHGLVERQQWGPIAIGGAAKEIVVRARRYLCTRCERVCCVVPKGVIPRLYYSAFALGLALALWGIEQAPARAVRSAVSPFVHVGIEARGGWASLRRWTRALARGELLGLGPIDASGTLGDQARAIATRLAGHALPGDRDQDLPSRAALGAVQVA